MRLLFGFILGYFIREKFTELPKIEPALEYSFNKVANYMPEKTTTKPLHKHSFLDYFRAMNQGDSDSN